MFKRDNFDQLKTVIGKLAQRQDLPRNEAQNLAVALFAGEFNDAQLGYLMMGLRLKGETPDELLGVLTAFQACTTFVAPPGAGANLIDVCGTGGDGLSANVFNISTTSMILAAAAGARVAKHGRSAISSQSGSTEVQRELGIPQWDSAEGVLQSLATHGMCYIHGPWFNKAMANVIAARHQTGMRSILNLLGPLSNPLKPAYQLLGVYDIALLDTSADVLRILGRERAMVVCAEDGLDELSVVAPTHVRELRNGNIHSYQVASNDLFGEIGRYENLLGGNPAQNARIAESILRGKTRGDAQNIVTVNAGAALYLASRAGSLRDGVELAVATIDSGQAAAKLDELRAGTRGGDEH